MKQGDSCVDVPKETGGYKPSRPSLGTRLGKEKFSVISDRQSAHSGNKTVDLTDCLKGLSKDKARWQTLIPGTTNSHKGTQKVEKKTKPKASTIRRRIYLMAPRGRSGLLNNIRTNLIPVTHQSTLAQSLRDRSMRINLTDNDYAVQAPVGLGCGPSMTGSADVPMYNENDDGDIHTLYKYWKGTQWKGVKKT
ncbi:hypothetical protein DFH07DRAFT_780723 [Mycena maculata]|uniref:Uncharacterized protein n=1 Tax=Mycena maculata TaxID=230809 RepID=A0AAD7I1N3_9AGAR|nr:hypothetical protein DFH07DRAFT_780723 [Mycena maculata]